MYAGLQVKMLGISPFLPLYPFWVHVVLHACCMRSSVYCTSSAESMLILHCSADCPTHCCCHPCAVCQETREVKARANLAPQHYQATPQHYQAAPQHYQAAPQHYQAAPQRY
jgi:hypothetical protein